ncbi:hypothetical protein RFI_11878 [Reticulomyxa filosa]|uniref:Uncharacterized protein n=1 Tax=Reticulomyxa filosa TaxID=46433 RepID=X6NH01_RETFI|nr:hypothetical protein RFI_11878 [Reticulomyxa filosa]|eukprot:ETO25261.1 hypothetical protein RFI_11878 [Reticulomyxa filosa]
MKALLEENLNGQCQSESVQTNEGATNQNVSSKKLPETYNLNEEEEKIKNDKTISQQDKDKNSPADDEKSDRHSSLEQPIKKRSFGIYLGLFLLKWQLFMKILFGTKKLSSSPIRDPVEPPRKRQRRVRMALKQDALKDVHSDNNKEKETTHSNSIQTTQKRTQENRMEALQNPTSSKLMDDSPDKKGLLTNANYLLHAFNEKWCIDERDAPLETERQARFDMQTNDEDKHLHWSAINYWRKDLDERELERFFAMIDGLLNEFIFKLDDSKEAIEVRTIEQLSNVVYASLAALLVMRCEDTPRKFIQGGIIYNSIRLSQFVLMELLAPWKDAKLKQVKLIMDKKGREYILLILSFQVVLSSFFLKKKKNCVNEKGVDTKKSLRKTKAKKTTQTINRDDCWKELSGDLVALYSSMVTHLFSLLSQLLQRESNLDDKHVQQLLDICFYSFGVGNFQLIQEKCQLLIENILNHSKYRHSSDMKHEVIGRIVDTFDNPKSKSIFCSRKGGKQILACSAVTLQLFQSMAMHNAGQESQMAIEQMTTAAQISFFKKMITGPLLEIQSLLNHFVGVSAFFCLFEKVQQKRTRETLQCVYRYENTDILTALISDLLAVYQLPEWPVAESLLRIITKYLVQILKKNSSVSSQTVTEENKKEKEKDKESKLENKMRPYLIDALITICTSVKRSVLLMSKLPSLVATNLRNNTQKGMKIAMSRYEQQRNKLYL